MITCPAASSFRSGSHGILSVNLSHLGGAWSGWIYVYCLGMLAAPRVTSRIHLYVTQVPLTCHHSFQTLPSFLPQNRAYRMCQRSSLLASCSPLPVSPNLVKFSLLFPITPFESLHLGPLKCVLLVLVFEMNHCRPLVSKNPLPSPMSNTLIRL